MLHVLDKTNTTNTTIHDIFLYFKICYIKKSDLYLRKIQISFWFKKKFRFASNEDANPFLFEEKFRSTSNEDADPFFILKENSDLHLIKMPIHFYFEKFRSTSKEDVDPILFEEN